MATHRIPILTAACAPDTSGNVYFEPHAINFGSNKRYPGMIGIFKDTGTRDKLGFRFRIPKNYIGNAKFVVCWSSTTAGGGNVRWEIDYTAIAASGESLDPATDQENLTLTSGAAGTARQPVEGTMTATAGNFAVDDYVQGVLARDGTDGVNDTLASSAYLFDLLFEYTDV